MGDRAGDEGAGLRRATNRANATLAISGSPMAHARSCARRDGTPPTSCSFVCASALLGLFGLYFVLVVCRCPARRGNG
eukprot:15430157-Alexandrium_andersonii.AAC.1